MARNRNRHLPNSPLPRSCALEGCSEKFLPVPWHKKYCSKDHQQAKYHGTKLCEQQIGAYSSPALDGTGSCYCGESITPNQFAWASDNTVFCSEPCADNYDLALENNVDPPAVA